MGYNRLVADERRSSGSRKPTGFSRGELLRIWEVKSILRLVGVGLTFLPLAILGAMLEPCSGAASGREYEPGPDTARLLGLHLGTLLATLFDRTGAIVALVAVGVGLIVLVASTFVPE